MPFPTSVGGQFGLQAAEDIDVPALTRDRTESLFARQGTSSVVSVGRTITWRRPFMQSFRMGIVHSSFDPVGSFNEIRFTVSGASSQAVVTYECDTRELLGASAVLSAVMSLLASTMGHSDLPTRIAIGAVVASIMFTWLFGASYVFASSCAPDWIEDRLSGVGTSCRLAIIPLAP